MTNEKSTIRALIVDDEAKSRSIIQTMLQKYCPQVEVIGMADSADAAQTLILSEQPNLVLLDIEMPHGSGFDLLNRLPEINFEIIFITGFDHYALSAIKFHALDYLLKPIDIDELIGAVGRVEAIFNYERDASRVTAFLQNMHNPDLGSQRIAIPTRDGREFIEVTDILYCEADGSCTWLYLSNGKRMYSSKNLGEFEKLLPGVDDESSQHFFRVHYGYLINISCIKSYSLKDNVIQMSNERTVDIAQRRKSTFRAILQRFSLS